LTDRRLRGASAAVLAVLLSAGCYGGRLRRIEDQNKQSLKRLEELQSHLDGMDKRLSVNQAMGQGPGASTAADGGAPLVKVASFVADPLAYSGRPVRVEAYLAGPVDKERAFFVVLSAPRDVINNVGVYYDAEDMSAKREVYLADPGDKLLIEGQLTVDRENNGFKTYSGYALKAKSVERAR
jgi:hypothetical protein